MDAERCRGEGVPWAQAIDSRVLRVISVADVARGWGSYVLIKNKNFCFTRQVIFTYNVVNPLRRFHLWHRNNALFAD